MNRNYIIWGSGGHARVLYDIINDNKDNLIALFDNSKVPSIAPEIPIFYGVEGFIQWKKNKTSLGQIYGAVAIGGDKGHDRIDLYNFFEKHHVLIEPLIHKHASISDFSRIARSTQVLSQTVIASNVEIGNSCIINNKASIDHDCEIGDGVHIAPGVTICGCVKIYENAFIGAGSVILPRVSIGKNTIVGAGSVVTKDLEDNIVAVGNPARVIRKNE